MIFYPWFWAVINQGFIIYDSGWGFSGSAARVLFVYQWIEVSSFTVPMG